MWMSFCWLRARSAIRITRTFFRQQDGSFLKDGKLSFDDVQNQGTKALQQIADCAKDGLMPRNTGYSSMVALFTAGPLIKRPPTDEMRLGNFSSVHHRIWSIQWIPQSPSVPLA